MEANRILLHQLLVKDGRLNSTYEDFNSFKNHYFSDDSGVNKVWLTCNTVKYKTGPKTGQIIFKNNISKFYKLYACDLSWAKTTTYCVGGGRVSRRYHDCPTGPYTQGCRSEVVRKVQKCIGVKDDSLFGPITQGALESKGFKNGFTDADVSKLCSNDSEENKPTVVLPDWTTCLKNLKKVSLSRDYDNVEIVMVPFANDKGYFWPTKEFLYLYKSGKEIRGSWSCDNSRLIIKTEDGQMWSETNGWETSVRRNNNNDDNNNNNNNNNINYQDDYTTYDDNEDNYE